MSLSPAAAEAAHYGLSPIGQKPTLRAYLVSLWDRRHFGLAFARSQLQADNSENRLGQLWQLLNPLLNAAVYYLIFHVILNASKGIQNFIAFLIVGVFTFGFTQKTILAGARSITGNMGLIRALHFPRALLPISSAIEELLRTGTSYVLLAAIVLLTGEPLSWTWLQLPAAVLLQLMFSVGVAFIFARLTASIRDVASFLPFAMRIWMYLSGVMYSITTFVNTHDSHPWIDFLLRVNPAVAYLAIIRGAFMASEPAPITYWYLALGWAVVALFGGFLFFYRGETSYGRG